MEENRQNKQIARQSEAAQQYALTEVGQNERAFALVQRKAAMYAQSTIVPQAYQQNVGNCVIALDMASRMGANPLMVMQNLYVVHGMPSFSSKFLIACINASKRFSPLRYEFTGKPGTPQYGCRCYAYEAGDTEHKERLDGTLITMEMAQKEGWSSKNGSKWQTMPDQMLQYRAAAFWQRIYCPEISMGLITTEEAQEIPYSDYEEIKGEAQKAIDENANSGEQIGFTSVPAQEAEATAPQPEPAQPVGMAQQPPVEAQRPKATVQAKPQPKQINVPFAL